jgi:hypothetical protein
VNHSGLVDGSSASPDVAEDKQVIVLQCGSAYKVIARLDLIKDDLRKISWGTGDFCVDAGDFSCNFAFLLRRQATFDARAVIGRHWFEPLGTV